MGPARSIATLAVLAGMLVGGGLAGAQSPTIAEQQARLKAANRASAAAEARSRALERAAEQARDRAVEARASEAAAAERIKAAEAEIAAARARIAIADRLLAAQESRLSERRGPILRLIAALQSMARRPAVLGLVQPGSTEDMVHVRAVLGATRPVVEARTAGLRAELARIRGLRAVAQAGVRRLRESQARLARERTDLLRLEAAHRARSTELERDALIESDRALALGERAREIVAGIDVIGAKADVRRSLSELPGPLPRPASIGAAPEPGPTPRAPAPYRLPVPGRLLMGLGELSDSGVRARGVTVAPSPGATVVSPASGRIRFAGQFRAYGKVVIVDHGQGWTSLVSGLDAVSVRVGERVAQGQKIGSAARGDTPEVTVELRRRGQPVDLVQLLE